MNSLFKNLVSTFYKPSLNVWRGKKQWMRPYLVSLYKRRLEQGPEPERPRSMWINWNYDGELFCFGKRLNEDFDLQVLRRAFITREYAKAEKERRKNILLDNSEFELDCQEELIREGDKLLNIILMKCIVNSYPLLPHMGHKSILKHLTSLEVLYHIASNLGLKDLILYPTCPIPENIISNTFKAIISTLDQSNPARTEDFVKDFILVQMIGKEVEDIWQISNPMGLLSQELRNRNMSPPEPRLLWATGTSTIMACYMVGIYSDKQYIGKGAGETLLIAEEMAARDCLNRFYDVTIKRQPLQYSDAITTAQNELDHVAKQQVTGVLTN